MDEEKFKLRVKRLEEISAAIAKLDPALRLTAIELLKSYVTGDGGSGDRNGSGGEPDSNDAAGDFFTKFSVDSPADAAKLLAGYHYKEYGVEAFSVKEMRDLADEVGVTIPDRIDATFNAAKINGNALFKRVGQGLYKPTVHGEKYFKDTYSVSKGRKSKPKSNGE